MYHSPISVMLVSEPLLEVIVRRLRADQQIIAVGVLRVRIPISVGSFVAVS